MEIKYCETCGKRIKPDDPAATDARDKPICSACTQKAAATAAAEATTSSTAQVAKVSKTMPSGSFAAASGRARRRTAATTRSTPGPGPSNRTARGSAPASGSGGGNLPYILGGVGLVLLLIGGAVLFGGRKSPPREQSSAKSEKSSNPSATTSPEEKPLTPTVGRTGPLGGTDSTTPVPPVPEPPQPVQTKAESDSMSDFLAERFQRKWEETLAQAAALEADTTPFGKMERHRIIADALRSFPSSRVKPDMEAALNGARTAATAALDHLLKGEAVSDGALKARIVELQRAEKLAAGLASEPQLKERLAQRMQEQLKDLLQGRKLLPGLLAELHRGDVGPLEKARTFSPHHTQIVTRIAEPRDKGRPYFKSGTNNKLTGRFSGFFVAAKEGNYNFHLLVEDGGVLEINGKRVLGEWDERRTHRLDGSVRLTPGPHTLLLLHHQGGGNWALTLEVTPPGEARRVCGPQDLQHAPGASDAGTGASN